MPNLTDFLSNLDGGQWIGLIIAIGIAIAIGNRLYRWYQALQAWLGRPKPVRTPAELDEREYNTVLIISVCSVLVAHYGFDMPWSLAFVIALIQEIPARLKKEFKKWMRQVLIEPRSETSHPFKTTDVDAAKINLQTQRDADAEQWRKDHPKTSDVDPEEWQQKWGSAESSHARDRFREYAKGRVPPGQPYWKIDT